MERSKSQLNAIYYAYRDRIERRRTAGKALYGWINPGSIPVPSASKLKSWIECGMAGEFERTCKGYRERRKTINWSAVCGSARWLLHYTDFERYRAAVRAQKSKYYRRRLAKLGIDWETVKRPYGTEGIELD